MVSTLVVMKMIDMELAEIFFFEKLGRCWLKYFNSQYIDNIGRTPSLILVLEEKLYLPQELATEDRMQVLSSFSIN